ncbi:uncharacterized protein LOC105893989 [Clupea harengus]|uniref:Uncharacterized protein LOC105893989 n=1 Tax=Clupea harengus TaxID=7950 RepID=A0A6P8GCT1_CLUHA|nr:uncharacterized protein LOC105893989 [Clupea harengus]
MITCDVLIFCDRTSNSFFPSAVSTISFSLTMNQNFDFRLNDPTSEIYKTYKTDIENAVENNFRELQGYKVDSAAVTSFRSGSVIVDFSLQSTNPSISFLDASEGVIKDLKAKKYELADNPFVVSERTVLREGTGAIFPLENMVLKCSGVTEWRFNGQKISGSSERLNIPKVSSTNNGRYECISTKNSVPFIQWERIDSIKPYPIIQKSENKTIQCKDRQSLTLQCCSSSDYEVEMVKVVDVNNYLQEQGPSENCRYSYLIQNCRKDPGEAVLSCKIKNPKLQNFGYSSKNVTLSFKEEEFACSDETFGAGNDGQEAKGDCEGDEVGTVTAVCQQKDWEIIEDACVLLVIQELEDESKILSADTLPEFVERLSNTTLENEERITNSTANMRSVVNILNNVANTSRGFTISVDVIENFLNASTVLVSNSTVNVWKRLNDGNTTRNVSASLLGSIEVIVGSLQDDTSFVTGTDIIQLRQTVVNSSYNETLGVDSSAAIFIPEGGNLTVTVTPPGGSEWDAT